MPVNPDSRWAVPFIPVLDSSFRKAQKSALECTKMSLIMIIVNIFMAIAIIISSFFSKSPVKIGGIFLSTIGWAMMTITVMEDIRTGFMQGVNDDQILDAIQGDMFAIQEVNIELVLTWIQNCNIAIGRVEHFKRTLINIQIFTAILYITSILLIWGKV